MDRLQGLLEVLCEREGGDALTVTATRASSSHRPDSTKHARAQLPREYETDPTDGTLSEVVGGAGGSAAAAPNGAEDSPLAAYADGDHANPAFESTFGFEPKRQVDNAKGDKLVVAAAKSTVESAGTGLTAAATAVTSLWSPKQRKQLPGRSSEVTAAAGATAGATAEGGAAGRPADQYASFERDDLRL